MIFAPESSVKMDYQPGVRLSTSTVLGWKSVLLNIVEPPAEMEQYRSLSTPDLMFSVILRGELLVESASPARVKSAHLRSGSVGLTAPQEVDLLRWRTISIEPVISAHLFLPVTLYEEACEELNLRTAAPANLLGCFDDIGASVVRSLAQGLKQGHPDLYAESAARFLVTHLALQTANRNFEEPEWKSGQISDRRLHRVLEYIDDRLDADLTIGTLASEAGVSSFHFARLFRKKLGVTPHSYVTRARMRQAAAILVSSDLSIDAVANLCGYSSAGHFAAAFRKQFGDRPAEFRRRKLLP